MNPFEKLIFKITFAEYPDRAVLVLTPNAPHAGQKVLRFPSIDKARKYAALFYPSLKLQQA